MYNLDAKADRKGIFLISGLVALIGGLCCLTPVVLVLLGMSTLAFCTANIACSFGWPPWRFWPWHCSCTSAVGESARSIKRAASATGSSIRRSWSSSLRSGSTLVDLHRGPLLGHCSRAAVGTVR
jgi:hypothetical protein